jgi:hypothetical protein
MLRKTLMTIRPLVVCMNHNRIVLGESRRQAYCCYDQCGNKGKAEAPV